jgi:hypothetical protein
MATRRQEETQNRSTEPAAVDDAFTREELLRKGGAAAVGIGLSGALAAPASALNRMGRSAQQGRSEIARAVLGHPRVIHEIDRTQKALVLALKDELLVLRAPQPALKSEYALLKQKLLKVARRSTTLLDARLGRGVGLPSGYDVEVWRLTNPDRDGDAFAQSRSLRKFVTIAFPPDRTAVRVPTVSPNHISVVSVEYDMCPDGPPRMAPEELWPRIPAYSSQTRVSVVVIDTGWIPLQRNGNRELTWRGGIRGEKGWWADTSQNEWRESVVDDFGTYRDFLRGLDRLAGVAGHGTFVAGVLAANCEHADITVVGHRHAVMPIPENGVAPATGVDAMRLFAAEVEIAGSILRHRDAQVINCGFAFPTLDGHYSIPFPMVLPRVDAGTVILAPAGNENTNARYWPAADKRVIGVAATDKDPPAKADFSNWGDWINCCSPGVDVVSTFGSVAAVPQDYPAVWGTPASVFTGWAFWNGTCFATPTVAARIASEAARGNVTPRQAWNALLQRAQRRVQFPDRQVKFISAVDPP